MIGKAGEHRHAHHVTRKENAADRARLEIVEIPLAYQLRRRVVYAAKPVIDSDSATHMVSVRRTAEWLPVMGQCVIGDWGTVSSEW